ncbi:H-NS family nucleoid-associated regulatory protein [Variovorax sp. Sphag1AA]|uniref:H-NS histone family protein n=1 Tax=Variovorax sp. Sphag1AA TaxID=2587027 RepID=UPI001613825B|nr:H-NS histone family protein [Variovorax sp. Sphag1AA]MBB3181009.1 DNA-binding protein H-NS [Variovorax sp. Sphag1AA]
MTKTYAQLKATIAKLEKEASTLRAAETTKVVAQIRQSIASFGLTVEQLFGRGAEALKAAAGKALGGGRSTKAPGKAARKGAGIPKYRDPKTGKTWTGFGKAPNWIATARSRDKFLIDQSGVDATSAVEEAVAPVVAVAKKAPRKTRTVAAPVKKSTRAKKAVPATASAPEVKAEKPVAKKVAAKKSASSKKAAPTKKKVVAPKAAKAPKVAAKATKKAAGKAVRSQPAAKTRSPRATTKGAAPVVTSAAPETTETGAAAS